MSEKSEMRYETRENYGENVGFELTRMERDSWKTIRGEGRGVDVNSKGLGLKTEVPLKVGEVLRLMVPIRQPVTTLPVLSEVRWILPEGIRYRVGLQFLM
jgi:hypothetical protein